MSAWHAVRGLAIFGLASVIFAASSLFVAVWTESEKWGQTGAILGAIAVLSGFAIAVMTLDEGMPRRPMSRSERRRLREEEARIRFDAEIRRMEREHGIGGDR